MLSALSKVESGTDIYRMPQFGPMISEILMDESSLESVISLVLDRPVLHLALTITEPDKENTTHVISSPKSSDLSMKSIPDTFSSRTSKQLHMPLAPDPNPTPEQSSIPFPKWGMTQGGVLSKLDTPELTTNEAVGSCWPTLTRSDAGKTSSPYGQVALGNHPLIFGDRKDRPKMSKSRAGDGLSTRSGQAQRELLNPTWCEANIMGFPVGWTDTAPLPPENYMEWLWGMELGVWWVNGMTNQVDPEEKGLPRTIPAKSVPKRNARIAALGNALVPAQLALFLRLIMDGE